MLALLPQFYHCFNTETSCSPVVSITAKHDRYTYPVHRYYPGVVRAVRYRSIGVPLHYDIDYDDGDVENNVDPSLVEIETSESIEDPHWSTHSNHGHHGHHGNHDSHGHHGHHGHHGYHGLCLSPFPRFGNPLLLANDYRVDGKCRLRTHQQNATFLKVTFLGWPYVFVVTTAPVAKGAELYVPGDEMDRREGSEKGEM